MAEMQDAKQNCAPWLTLPTRFLVCYLNVIVTFAYSAYITTPKQCFAYNCNCFNCDLQTHLPSVI